MNNEGIRLYLVRHGETVNTREVFRFNGQTDVDITELGVRQMEAVAQKLEAEPVKWVYSSGLIRTLKGAQIISDRHNLMSAVDERFKELHAGRWEGLSFAEVRERFPEEAHVRYEDLINYRVIGGGESLIDLRNRVIPALDEIIERHRGEAVALVGHGGVNRIILCHALNMGLESFFRLEQDFGCLNVIDFYDGTAVVRLMNFIPEGI